MAKEKNQDAAKAAAAGGGGPSKLAKLALPLFALFNLVVLGGGTFLTYQATLGWVPPAVREPAAIERLKFDRETEGVRDSVLYTMPTFTVNLDGQPRRIVRVTLTLEMLDKDGFEEVVRNSPAARDSIVRILNSKTYDEIETIQGKLFLKDQIAVTLNRSLDEGVVKDVYFGEFLVQ
jgi:flagellar FliL protein